MRIKNFLALAGNPTTGQKLAIDTEEGTRQIDYDALATAIINKLGGDPVTIAHGGTGATSVAAARNALGLGNTSGALPVANGGTGATSAADARTNLGVMGEEIPIIDNAVTFKNGGIQYTNDSSKSFQNYKYVDLYFQVQGSECAAQRIYMGYADRTRKIGLIALNGDDGGVRQVACVFTTAGRYITDCIVKFSNNNGSFSTIDTILTLVRAVGYKW